VEDGNLDSSADLNAMFADINNLPADDPLRSPALVESDGNATIATEKKSGTSSSATKSAGVLSMLPAKVLAAFRSAETEKSEAPSIVAAAKVVPVAQPRADGGVVVDASKRVAVPAFDGAALRTVVETADGVGLRVQAVGSGLAREQVPAAGTMVPAGTEVVVRFAR
jgi:cell division protein FtsI (penicillin-binding protein 3)